MSTKCTTDADLYENIGFCPGQASLPGVRPHFYLIRRADIVSFPKVGGSSAASLDAVCTISADFTLAESKKWKVIDLIEGESEPTCESQGSEGCKSFKNRVELVIPGTEKKVSAMIAMLNNDDVIIAYPQRNGRIRIIGNEMFRVQLELSQTNGKAVTDSAQTKVIASVDDVNPAPFYEGKIATADGNIDGATDTITGE